MKLFTLGKIAGALAVTIALAGCVDMTEEVNVTSDTTAKTTMTMTMAADIYAMMKSADAASQDGVGTTEKFCTKPGEQLTENKDGTATCVATQEGPFADLSFSEGDTTPTFTAVSPGVVKVAIPTAGMAGSMGTGSSDASSSPDPQGEAMIQQLFANHFLTIRVSGKAVTDSNMTISDDKTSAEIKIPFTDLFNGTAKLPAELYAVVSTN
jgi:hypothetical protein